MTITTNIKTALPDDQSKNNHSAAVTLFPDSA